MMLPVCELLHGLLCHEKFNTMLVSILHLLNSTIHYALHTYHEENLIRILNTSGSLALYSDF